MFLINHKNMTSQCPLSQLGKKREGKLREERGYVALYMHGICTAAGRAEPFLFAVQNEQVFHQFILDLSFIEPSFDLVLLVEGVQREEN
jgi:hypothetical protein